MDFTTPSLARTGTLGYSAGTEKVTEVGPVVAIATGEHVEQTAQVGHRLFPGLLLAAEDAAEQVSDPSAGSAATPEQIAEAAPSSIDGGRTSAATGTGLVSETTGQPGHDERSEHRQQLGKEAGFGLPAGPEALLHGRAVRAEQVAEDLLAIGGVNERQRVVPGEDVRVVILQGGRSQGLCLAGLDLEVETTQQRRKGPADGVFGSVRVGAETFGDLVDGKAAQDLIHHRAHEGSSVGGFGTYSLPAAASIARPARL